MKHLIKPGLCWAAALMATQALAQVTLYEHDNFAGRSYTAQGPVTNMGNSGFNDRASSARVQGRNWEVCEDAQFAGRCVVLRPGRYASLGDMGLNDRISSVRAVSGKARVEEQHYAPPPVAPQAIFYENEGFRGQNFTASTDVRDLRRFGFNDRASSVVVLGERFEVCTDSRFSGQCVVLRPGRYPSLAAMGINDQVSSVRAVDWKSNVDEARYAPPPAAVYDSRQRHEERVFDATVTSVHAVVGPPEQRCWMEREEVAQPQREPNVGGAIAGALLGGILGHQVGGGVGKDLATVGGAVAGAALGSRAGGGAEPAPVAAREVRRCANQPAHARPEFWDVSYTFRGVEHRVQMTSAPGATIKVNERGEPRT
jgi:uncharacterized protein YcfJ